MLRAYKRCIEHKVRYQQQQKSLSYHVALWVLFIACTVWAVVDRLTVNMWSLGVNHTFPHQAVWGVQVFEVFSWVSGRISIVTTSILFLTQCRTTMNIFVDWCPQWMYIGDIHRINNSIHKFAGWFTAIIILLHVWLIFLGPLTSGTKLVFLESQSQRSEVPFYDHETEELALAPDDVWRLIEMTFIFLILIPLSMWTKVKMCRRSRYTTAMIIHLIAGIMFAIDIIRKKSHPHSKVFNIPVVVYWFFDRLAGIFLYRSGKVKIIKSFDFDEGRYLVLFLQTDTHLRRKDGEVLYLQFERSGIEYAHPFTMWSKRGILNGIEDQEVPKISCTLQNPDDNTVVYEWSKAMTGKGSDERVRNYSTTDVEARDTVQSDYVAVELVDMNKNIPSYDYACIVKVIEHENKTKLTWTQKLYQKLHEKTLSPALYPTLDCFGPYHTLFHNLRAPPSMLPGMVFIGSGAGASPLIDFHQYITHHGIQLQRPVIMLYTCNSPELFEFVASILMSHHIENYSCKGWITQYRTDEITHVHEFAAPSDTRVSMDRNNPQRGSRRIEEVNCRVSLFDELTRAKEMQCTDVFFCGNPKIEHEIQEHCRNVGLAMNLGHTVG